MSSDRPFLLIAALAALIPCTPGAEPPPVEAPATAAADDDGEIVVTADRQANELARTTSTVAIVDAAALAERGHPAQVHEALRDLPGVQIQHLAGGVGSLTRVRMRGAQSSDTQLQIDGIPFNDPADFNSSPDLIWLSPAGLSRIEVVKGAQSGLYGSRAAGGVVNLITARPTDAHHADGRIEYGSFDTARAEVSATGPIAGSAGYALGVSGLHSDGFSVMTDAGAEGDDNGHEADGFRRLGGNARIEAGSKDLLRGYVALAGSLGETEYDSFAGFPTFAAQPDDALPVEELESWRASGGGTAQVHEDVALAADLAITDYDREYPNETSAFSSALRDTRELYGAVRATWDGIEHTALTLGVDARRSDLVVTNPAGDTLVEGDDDLVGIWAQGLYAPDDYELSLVARRDEHSREGDASTFRLGGAYPLFDARLTLLGAVASGFRAPSLSELFDPAFGDPDLEAQESEHYEIGARIAVSEEVELTGTWFATDYRQRIGFDPTTFRSRNEPGATVEGVESALAYTTRPLSLMVHYTAMRSDDGTGAPLADTPEHRAGIVLTHRTPGERAWFRVAAERVGRRVVVGTDLDPYLLASASAGVWATRWLELYARAENLTGTRYEVNPGFTTAERSTSVGLGARW